ncbi:DUF305 domain-containing protein [Streptomyces bambusae]|uniref:DUF305 domain-containing protein n=1 Tax=Streptomyces bambusae TaxID=1550616 RepID=A0ABS6ZAB8_9ACTN|nr:DUF305 domain-containing protein [Streptomyces bambusae]MBW5484714.1 DUF305 domain-containing protein [Streptomyces bambusae]
MDTTKGLRRPRVAAVAAAVLLLGLGGCRGGDGADAADGGGQVVIAPGRPGDTPRTLSPEQAARQRPDDSPNAADQSYVANMVVHHRQALTMTALAPDRAGGEAVKRLAERIKAAQQPEIGAMEGWQKKYPAPAGQAGGPSAGHDHHAMPGMATEQQLAELSAARGADFDRIFLRLMTAHHQGALKMAGDVLAAGNNVAVEEMATEVVAQQTAEIHRMRAMG